MKNPPHMPLVSLVVVTYNQPRRLYECIVSILHSTYTHFELIVVNNGNFPLNELIDGIFKDKRIKIFCPDEGNLGYPGGINYGVMHASGKILAIVNDDIVLHPRYIENAVSFLNENPGIHMVSSKVFLMRHYRMLNSIGQTFSPSLKPLNIGDGEVDSPKHNKARPVFAASGPVFMVRKEIFLNLNGFSEDFFLSYEDLDFFWRAYLGGYECRYVPDMVAYHYRNESIQTIPARILYYSIRNRMITLTSHHSFLSLLISLPFIFLFNLKHHYVPQFLEFRLKAVFDALKLGFSQKRKTGLPPKRSSWRLFGKIYRS